VAIDVQRQIHFRIMRLHPITIYCMAVWWNQFIYYTISAYKTISTPMLLQLMTQILYSWF
jgi:hypothetical protein